ncbi:MAG: DUF962 domain-containing protein [Burkholderiaceae bacterium]|nr:MAG: DUF962 domain-containing protein [Burkholderiaceae bacterium]
MFFGKPWGEWVVDYAQSHQHPVNRFCHTIGIPLVAFSVLLWLATPLVSGMWPYALGLFIVGWVFQFLGHWFEGKPPEFFHDWRYLFVGLRWWWMKIRGQV